MNLTHSTNDQANREARNKFLKEARMMRKYDHKHVVKVFNLTHGTPFSYLILVEILGVAVHEHPLMIVMECCEGEMRDQRSNITSSQ